MMLSRKLIRRCVGYATIPFGVILYLNIETLASKNGWDTILSSAWEANMPTLYGFLTTPAASYLAVFVLAFAAGAWLDNLLRRSEAHKPNAATSMIPALNSRLDNLGSAVTDSAVSTPIDPMLAGMKEIDRDDFDLVPLRFFLRGKRSDDGIDILAVIQFRNRSKGPVAIKPLPGSAIFNLDEKNDGNKSSGISNPIAPQTSAGLQFTPIRIYNESDPIGNARLSLMFGLSQESMRTVLDMNYTFQVRSYPENKSIDAVLEIDIIENRTKYYLKGNPD